LLYNDMTKTILQFFAGLVLLLQGCVKQPPPPPKPQASPHYELGAPYAAGGTWYYPAENYRLDETGIAAIDQRADGLTADGELRDPTALTAAMQTIQLPAIVEVTNLENGRQIDVRVNDRGPATPARIIALSPRAALLLQVPPGGARVRVRVDEVMSHRVVDQLGGGPQLAIAAAPHGVITAEALPPPGSAGTGQTRVIGAAHAEAAQAKVADRLPENLRSSYADPGALYLRCGSFTRGQYAYVTAAKLSGLGATVLRSYDGRQSVFSVRAGPFATIPEADTALSEALRRGVIDARITVQ
jgi:rare lipoprotein A